jgi:hypothetical protein
VTVRLWSLPVDIPWKRIAINEDMYATDWNWFPQKWRSSMAVYAHEPEPDPAAPEDPDERTTFLKVVVSLTGYQPGATLARLKPIGTRTMSGPFSGGLLPGVEKLDVYYPAYSALLQLAVYPEGGDWKVEQYPYFSDFEPKKREVIELVSDTGEFVTQSNTGLNVRKGSTTTDSAERVSIDHGGSIGAQVSGLSFGVGVSKADSREVGTRSKSGTEGVNLINTDASQEKRETFSHTTNLSQLYQVLDSYHAGTNRAVFFINARPHLMQSPYTFVNGPRHLEGIQEFFFVVRRPKEMEEICVKAVLETAHLHETAREYTTGETRWDLQDAMIDRSLHAVHANGGYAEQAPGKWRIDVPAGYVLDTDRGGRHYSVTWGNGVVCEGEVPAGTDWWFAGRTSEKFLCDAVPTTRAYVDHAEFEASVTGADETDGHCDYKLFAYFKSINPIEVPQKKIDRHIDIFVTADQITSCAGRKASRDYVSFERDVTELVKDKLDEAKKGGADGVAAANAVGRTIREELARSIGSATRYAPGKVDFLATKTALRTLMGEREGLTELPGLEQKIEAVAPERLRDHVRDTDLTIRDTLAHTPERLADKLKIDPVDARALMMSALVAEATQLAGPARIQEVKHVDRDA